MPPLWCESAQQFRSHSGYIYSRCRPDFSPARPVQRPDPAAAIAGHFVDVRDVDVADISVGQDVGDRVVMIADDSTVARNQVKRALEPLGINMVLAKNGQDALDQLRAISAECEHNISEKVALLISDIEMPEMDGYTLTAEVKNDERMRTMPVILHTSLSGVFNNAMVEKVGAEDFIPKFHPDELATAVKKWLRMDDQA